MMLSWLVVCFKGRTREYRRRVSVDREIEL